MKKYLYTFLYNTSQEGVGVTTCIFTNFEGALMFMRAKQFEFIREYNLPHNVSNEYFDSIGSDMYWGDTIDDKAEEAEFHFSNVHDDFYIDIRPLPEDNIVTPIFN